MAYIAVAQAARKLNLQPSYLQRLVKRQKISSKKKGKRRVVDPVKVKYELESMADPSREGTRRWAKMQKGKGPGAAAAELENGIDGETERGKGSGREDRGESLYGAYTKSKITKEHLLARKAELELKKREGELIEIDEVVRQNKQIDRIIRGKLISLSNRVAPKVVNVSSIPKIKSIVDDAVNDVLSELYAMREEDADERID